MSESETLRHIVLLQFKSGTSITDLDEIVQRFVRLEKEIEEVDGIDWGVNISHEGLDQGFTHCFNLSFANISNRDTYLTHPHHLAFAEWVKEFIEKIIVIDYCPGK